MQWRLLECLSDTEARALLARTRRRRFRRREVIFHEGDPGDTLHLLDKGHVAVRLTTPLGDTATLRILGPGDTFGEMAVISPGSRTATIEAVEPTETLAIHRDQFEELRSEHPAVDRMLLTAAISEVQRLSLSLLDALYVPVPKRVMRRLVELAALYGDGVLIPLTQEDLADLAGTSRPTANKVLQSLQEQGVIEISRGRVSVTQLAGLRRLAG